MTLRVGTLAEPHMLTGPLERRRELLEHVASAGIDHVFVADHVSFHTGFGMDGLMQAATVAALEPTLRVHIGVFLLALRHPVPVARQIATFCESAPGRLVLGVGIGGEDRHEIEICEIDPRTRGRRTDAALRHLRSLLSGVPTDADDEFYRFDAALIRPAPDPPVPIVIGGRSTAAVVRAATLGDGWLGVWCSARRYAEVVTQVAEAAAGAGRTDVDWDHGLQVWIGLDSDRKQARERLARRMEKMYQVPFDRFERYSPFGSPEEIAAALAPYAEAGCEHLNLMPVADSPEAAIDGVAAIRELLGPI